MNHLVKARNASEYRILGILLLIFLFPLWVTAQSKAEPVKVQFTDGTSALVRGLAGEDKVISDSAVVINATYKTIQITRIGDEYRKDFGSFPDEFAKRVAKKFGVFLEYAVYDKDPEYNWNNHRRICEHTVQDVLYQNKCWIRATNSFNGMLNNPPRKTDKWEQDARNPKRKKPLYVDVWLLSIKDGIKVNKYIVFDKFRD